MAATGKQSPLGVNVLCSLLQNTGFFINPTAAGYMGASTAAANYTFGTICNSTCLNVLTTSIRRAYTDGLIITSGTYNNLISIGSNTIPALGNSLPPTYTWTGNPTWLPYNTTNPTPEITSYGFVRLFALQAYDEFNYNDTLRLESAYRDFLTSFSVSYSFIEYSNASIITIANSSSFLKGTYSNMNDLISADITGVNLATTTFGQDLILLGKAIDLSTMYTFGLPSNLLNTLQQNNAITSSLSLALLSSGIPVSTLTTIIADTTTTTTEQQRNIYGAFLIIVGDDLAEILVTINCKTQGLESLADLLNPKKLFPNSYRALTVPIYNAAPGPTNSKTYYPIYDNEAVSPVLVAPAIVAQIGPVYSPDIPQQERGGWSPADFGGFGGDSGSSGGGGIGSGSGYQ